MCIAAAVAAAMFVIVIFGGKSSKGVPTFFFVIALIQTVVTAAWSDNIKRKIKKLQFEIARDERLKSEAARAERERVAAGECAEVIIKEKIIEKTEVIVFVRCSHCGKKYDEKLPNCPNCGGE
jgi:hypothetical protein